MKKLIALYIVLFTLCDAKLIEMSQKQKDDLGIEVEAIGLVENLQYGPFNGRIIKEQKDVMSIGFAYEGIVEEIYVKKNQSVKYGDRLLSVASQELLVMQTQYLNEMTLLEEAQSNFQRDTKLLQSGIISQKRFLESKREEKNQNNKVALLRERLYLSGFDAKNLELLQTTRMPKKNVVLYAQAAGIIEEIFVNKGEKVSNAQKLITFANKGSQYIQFQVPLGIISKIALGDQCIFGSNRASIVSIAKTLSLESQSVEVRALLAGNDHLINQIVPLMVSSSIPQSYKVKKSAVVFYQNKPYIFVVKDEGFESMAIQIVAESETDYTIQAKINKDANVAIRATSALLGAMEEEDE